MGYNGIFMGIEYTDLILASSETGGYPKMVTLVLPGRKHGHRGARAVPAGKKTAEPQLRCATDLEKAWFDTSFISGVPEIFSFNSGNHPVQDILSRLHHRASKGIQGPCSKSQSWPLSSMTYFDPNGKTFLKCFVYVHSDWPAEYGLIPMSLSHVMWLEKYVCIYIYI